MAMPFTKEQFFNIFAQHNSNFWPILIIFFAIACAIIYLLLKKDKKHGKIISTLMGIMWLWTGLVYHLIYFSEINKAAVLFGTFFILQSLLFFYFGTIKEKIKYKYKGNASAITGLVLMLFAILVYPLLGYFLGHDYPSFPIFPLPCPLTIFTLGLLLNSNRLKKILIIPIIWALIGSTAVIQFGVIQDISLAISGIITLFFYIRKT